MYVADIDDDNDLDVLVTGYYLDDVVWYESTVGVEEETTSNSPSVIALAQPYPNPFKEKTDIKFSVGRSAKGVELKIYDATGKFIRTLVAGDLWARLWRRKGPLEVQS